MLAEAAVDEADLGASGIGAELAIAIENGPHRRQADRLQAPVAVEVVARRPAPAVGAAVFVEPDAARAGQALRSHDRVDEGRIDDGLVAQLANERRLEDLLEPGFRIGRGLCRIGLAFVRAGSPARG